MSDGDQYGRGGGNPIPDVMMHCLEVPDAFAGFRVQRQFTIAEQVIAQPVTTIKVKRGRTGRNVNDAGLLIYRHSGPVIGAAAFLPCVFRPGVITEFAGTRNGMKTPVLFSGANIIGADIPRKSGEGLGQTSTDDEEILVDDGGTGQRDEAGGHVSAKPLAQIDASLIAEACDRLASVSSELVNEVHDADDNATVFVVGAGPIRQTANGLGPDNTGVEFPFQFAGCGVEGKNFLRRRNAVQHPSYFNGTSLQTAGFSGVIRPGNFKLLY